MTGWLRYVVSHPSRKNNDAARVGHPALWKVASPSQRSFEERRRDQQRADAEREQKQQVVLDGLKAAVLEDDCLESVNRVREWIDDGDGLKPFRERGHGKYGPGGKEKQRVEDTEHGARNERIVDADHHEKHHAVESDGHADDEHQQLQHLNGMEDGAEPSHERADDGEADSGEHGLDGSGDVEAHDQFELGDGSDKIALVNAARLVVDVQHSAADHHGDVHRKGAGSSEQELHVGDVGVKLDELDGDVLDHA